MKAKILGAAVLGVLALAMLLTLAGLVQGALAETAPAGGEQLTRQAGAAVPPEDEALWKLVCPFH